MAGGVVMAVRTIILAIALVLLVFLADVVTDTIIGTRYGTHSAHLDGKRLHTPVAPVGWVELVRDAD